MRVIRWKNAATGVESLNITATGVYFPVGKEDAAFIARYVMASAGQTASVEIVRDSNGTRVGVPGVSVSGVTEIVSQYKRSLAFGIIVTAISGTLIATLDDQIVRTIWPDNLGRFPAQADLDAFTYGGTGLDGSTASVLGVQYTYGAGGWEEAGGGAPLGISGRTIMILGDSISVDNAITGGWYGGLILSASGNLVSVKNSGVSGNTTQNMIDRFATDVVPYPSNILVIQSGSNDLPTKTAAQHTVLFKALVTLAMDTGRRVIVVPIPPRDGYESLSSQYRTAEIAVAQSLGAECMDIWWDCIDTADGGWLSSDTYDGLHPTDSGKQKAVTAAVKYLNVASGNAVPLPTVNSAGAGKIANPLFIADTNTDGIADGWATSGATSTPSLVPARIGKAQRVTIPGGTTGTVTLQSSAAITVTGGNKHQMCGAVSANLSSAYLAIQLRWQTAASADIYRGTVLGVCTSTGEFSAIFTAPENAAKCYIIFTFGPAAGGGSGVFEVSQCQLTDVTALGI